MNTSDFQVRRATLEDLAALTALWQSMSFNPDELVRHITEFQVAEDAQGQIQGCLAMQIVERQGLIHSEAFNDFSLSENLRELFWQRMNSLATNHGLLRLWTREAAPFWSRCGLLKAEPAALEKLPSPWRGPTAGWLTLKLRDDLETAVASVDKEFTLFMQMEKQRSKRMIESAKIVKTVLTTCLILAFLGILIAICFFVMRNPQLLKK